MLRDLFWANMKKRNHKFERKEARILQERHVGRLIVKPIGSRIKKYRAESRKQFEELLELLNEVNDSANIMAREIARQLKGQAEEKSRFESFMQWFKK